MPDVNTYRLPKFQNADEATRFQKLIRTVGKAHRDRIIQQIPSSASAATNQAYPPSQIRVISNRLYLLDYLDKRYVGNRLTKYVKEAITKFQNEAHYLNTDGWVGAKTWEALQELVSFEDPTNLERWLNYPGQNHALRRAVNLRLKVLGFLDERQPRSMRDTLSGLSSFARIARELGLLTGQEAASFQLPMLMALFNMDGMLAGIAQASRSFFNSNNERFLFSVAKIELWLLGYKVIPDGSISWRAASKDHWQQEAPVSLRRGMQQFWEDLNMDKRQAKKRAKQLDAAFFKELVSAEDSREERNDTEDLQLFENELQDRRVAQSTWTQVRSLGSRLWDGVKRTFRWVVRIIKKGFKKAAHWVKALARSIYSAAMKVFEPVRVFVNGLKKSISFLLQPVLSCSVPDQITVVHDGDFDFINIVSPNADPQVVRTCTATVRKQSRLFSVSARLLALFLDILISTMRKIALGGGWFGFIVALAKLRPKIGTFVAFLNESRELQGA